MKLDNKMIINKIKNEKTWISAKELAEFLEFLLVQFEVESMKLIIIL